MKSKYSNCCQRACSLKISNISFLKLMIAKKTINKKYKDIRSTLDLGQLYNQPGELLHKISLLMSFNVVVFLNNDNLQPDNGNIKAVYPHSNNQRVMTIIEYFPGKKSNCSTFSAFKLNVNDSKVISFCIWLMHYDSCHKYLV